MVHGHPRFGFTFKTVTIKNCRFLFGTMVIIALLLAHIGFAKTACTLPACPGNLGFDRSAEPGQNVEAAGDWHDEDGNSHQLIRSHTLTHDFIHLLTHSRSVEFGI
jgi:hypothetical protein